MANRVRRVSPTGWLISGFLIWIVAFGSAKASAPTAADRSVPAENSAVLRTIPQSQAPTAPQNPPATTTPTAQSGFAPTGEKACLDCHDTEQATLILQTPHAVKADKRSPFAQHQCETCHGASPGHIDDPGAKEATVIFTGSHRSPAATRNEMCISCHESGIRTHWTGSEHEARGVACNDCHTVHAREQKVLNKTTQGDVCFTCHKEQRAQVHRISTHPLAVTSLANTVKMSCSDCHNPHGSSGPKMLVKNSVNETCYTCHAEKRGPFLWEHAPVTDDCTNCHTPHGSNNASLLKARPPLLCQQCHSGDHGAQINSGENLAGGNVTTVNQLQQPGASSPRAQLAARGCVNCHVLIHGSNHPAGAKYQR